MDSLYYHTCAIHSPHHLYLYHFLVDPPNYRATLSFVVHITTEYINRYIVNFLKKSQAHSLGL
jgi:hypothetical protein